MKTFKELNPYSLKFRCLSWPFFFPKNLLNIWGFVASDPEASKEERKRARKRIKEIEERMDNGNKP